MDKHSGPGKGSYSSGILKYVMAAAFGVVLALLVIVIFGAVYLIFAGGTGFPGLGASSDPEAPAGVPGTQPSDPSFAFLLLGYGGRGHEGAYLTDSIMVAIVDPARKSLTLLSIPRDSWVPLVFNEQTTVYNKLNTAYAFAKDSSLYPQRLPRYQGSHGAGLFAMDTVARQLGIPISYYMALDFDGFRKAIDAVGGIDVDVPASFTARYPANDDPSIDPSWTEVSFEKGRQNMDGETAIRYARAREAIDNLNEGTDFARSNRQRLIIEAFKTKLFQFDGLVHLSQLMEVASQHVDTNYSIPSIPQIGQLALGWKDVRFYQAALTNDNYLVDSVSPEGSYILVPDASDQSWEQIQAFANRLWKDPELGEAMANTLIVVENDAGVNGLAGQVSAELTKLGYRVGTPISGEISPSSTLVDMTGADSGGVIERGIEADLGIQLERIEGERDAGLARVVLKLGQDYVSR